MAPELICPSVVLLTAPKLRLGPRYQLQASGPFRKPMVEVRVRFRACIFNLWCAGEWPDVEGSVVSRHPTPLYLKS